jgi:hypothetical protein
MTMFRKLRSLRLLHQMERRRVLVNEGRLLVMTRTCPFDLLGTSNICNKKLSPASKYSIIKLGYVVKVPSTQLRKCTFAVTIMDNVPRNRTSPARNLLTFHNGSNCCSCHLNLVPPIPRRISYTEQCRPCTHLLLQIQSIAS